MKPRRTLAVIAATGALCFHMGTTSAEAAPTTLDLTGTVTTATGNWEDHLGTAFSTLLTFDLDETEAYDKELISPSGETPFYRWTYHNASPFDPYGARFTGSGSFSGAFTSFETSTVTVETFNDFDANAAGNPFGVTGIVDGLSIAGSSVVVACNPPHTVDPVTGCSDPNAPFISGEEFNITLVGASGWLDNASQLPASLTPPGGLKWIIGDGEQITGSQQSASMVIAFPLPSAVPVPAALPLFGTGLAILGFAGWRKRRSA